MPKAPFSTARIARLETLESRLVLSAQAPIELQVEGELTSPLLDTMEVSADLPESAVAGVHEYTGVGQVHQDYGFSGSQQTVAVIDTGIAYDHFALGGGYGSNYRVVGGWDFAENDADPYDDGPSGFHGTHVAGIVGSDADAARGVAHEADMVALRVFDDQGRATFGWVEQALQWVVDHQHAFENPITTVNLSLGAEWNSDSVPNWAMLEDEFQVLESRGIFISVAAGNSFANYGQAGLSYPAVSPYVVPVASVDAEGNLSDFSQRNERVIAAPGEQIVSTVPNHLFGSTQQSNRFLAASGTSMAAPYLAGASMLLREAMDLAGEEAITQDRLYDYMRETADAVWDSATSASYYRLNLQRAMGQLLQDQVGDTAAHATSLGTLNNSLSWSSRIDNLQDRDAYSFVAGQSGTVTMSFDTTHEMVADWQVNGRQVTAANNSLTFDVVAGQTVDLSLASSAGLGRYSFDMSIAGTSETTRMDLGTVVDHTAQDVRVQGEHWVEVRASRHGTLTFLATPRGDAGPTQVAAFDADGNHMGHASWTEDGWRVDVDVRRGDEVHLRMQATDSNFDIRAANIMRHHSTRVFLFGSDSADRFELTQSNGTQVSINGLDYQFRGEEATVFRFYGGDGVDHFQVQLDEGSSSTSLRNDRLWMRSGDLRVAGHSIERLSLDAGAGVDRVAWRDSAGNDQVTVSSEQARFENELVQFQATNLERVHARGGQGIDTLHITGSPGDDRVHARGDGRVWVRSDEMRIGCRGFRSVTIDAGMGNDRLSLVGTDRSETYMLSPEFSFMAGAGSSVAASDFEHVHVRGRGGSDQLFYFTASHQDQIRERAHRTIVSGDEYRFVIREVEHAHFAGVMAFSPSGLSGSTNAFSMSAVQSPSATDRIAPASPLSQSNASDSSWTAGTERTHRSSASGQQVHEQVFSDLGESAGNRQLATERGPTAAGTESATSPGSGEAASQAPATQTPAAESTTEAGAKAGEPAAAASEASDAATSDAEGSEGSTQSPVQATEELQTLDQFFATLAH